LVMAKEVVVAFWRRVVPRRVDDDRRFEETELKAPAMVVEPVTASVPVAVMLAAVRLPEK